MTLLRLATRASPLALWQARWVAARLRQRHPGLVVQLVRVVSSGDRDRSTALSESATVGMFVKEIQDTVASGGADAGVHSCKDLPTSLPPGLVLAAVLPRADPRDALVGVAGLARLPQGGVVGTSSLRRGLQLTRLRPDLRIVPIRGNVETRVAQVREGRMAATILAMAGLARLGLARQVQAVGLHPIAEMVPSPAQGAVAVDCRHNDVRAHRLLAAISHPQTHQAITIERAVLAAFAGGCSLPLGCLARRQGVTWEVVARLCQAGGGSRDAQYRGHAAGAAAAILAQLG